jgi:hypothetical protein
MVDSVLTRGESDDGRRKNEKNPEGAERTIQKGMNRGRRECVFCTHVPRTPADHTKLAGKNGKAMQRRARGMQVEDIANKGEGCECPFHAPGMDGWVGWTDLLSRLAPSLPSECRELRSAATDDEPKGGVRFLTDWDGMEPGSQGWTGLACSRWLEWCRRRERASSWRGTAWERAPAPIQTHQS